MKNKDIWTPTKYEYRKGKLRASRNKSELSPSSVLFVDLIAIKYEEYLKDHSSGKLLDLGCGKVPLFQAYKNFIEDNICVDWENSLHKNPFLDYLMNLNDSLNFNDNEFDTIILSDVLEHIENPRILWNEMFRILRPSGKLILNVPFLYHIHEQPYDFFRYTKYALLSMAEKSGLRVILIEEIGGFPEVLADLLAKNIKHFPWIGNNLSVILQKLTLAFVKSNIGKKISEKTSKNFPLGYFLIAQK